jgi:hypothetical protein
MQVKGASLHRIGYWYGYHLHIFSPYEKSGLVVDSKMEILSTLLVYRIESETNASDVVMFTSVCEE